MSRSRKKHPVWTWKGRSDRDMKTIANRQFRRKAVMFANGGAYRKAFYCSWLVHGERCWLSYREYSNDEIKWLGKPSGALCQKRLHWEWYKNCCRK